MQDRYAGDVGDFGKFSLLRSLFSDPKKYSIGVVWYKYPNESHNEDGRHIDYLSNSNYKQCDQNLIKGLSHVVKGERSIARLEILTLLPKNTIYYSSTLDFHNTWKTQSNEDKSFRKNERIEWLKKAIESTSSCNVIFLDPDNGLEIPSIPHIHQIRSGKYAYYSEVASFFENKEACVIYHHLNMNNPHEEQIKFRAKELKRKIPKIGSVFALRFKPYSPRAFFICSKADGAETIKGKINKHLSGACSIGWDSYHEV